MINRIGMDEEPPLQAELLNSTKYVFRMSHVPSPRLDALEDTEMLTEKFLSLEKFTS